MPRRQFLRISSAAAVGLTVVVLSEGDLFAASPVEPLLGVGYAASLPKPGFSTQMTDASSILTPDPTFLSRRARVTVVGGVHAQKNGAPDGGIALDALFPVTGRDQAHYARFSFWTAVAGKDVDSVAGNVSFTIPAVSTSGISFTARRIHPSGNKPLTAPPPLEPENSPLTLSLGAVPGPKLQRGVYAFAFREDGNDTIGSWSRVSLVNQGGVYTLSGVGVTYVILNIGYAS